MRKLLYLFCFLLMAFTACDPMEDVYEELDSTKVFDPASARVVDVILTEANYKSLQGKTGVPDYVSKNFYFTSEEEAGALIPLYLNSSFKNYDNQDMLRVTYNLLTKSFAGNTVTDYNAYTLTNADYALGGSNFPNFDRWSQIETFLNARYPTPLQGRLVNLTFTWFSNNQSPTAQTRTDSYFYTNDKWEDAYLVTADDYLKVDRNRNNAFAPADEAMLPAYFDNFLRNKIFGAKAGDIQYVSYAVRMSSSSTVQNVMAMIFDGSSWTKLTKIFFTEPKTLNFILTNGIWVPDLRIRYTLTNPDYETIAGIETIGTELNRANLKDFHNFYQAGSATDTRRWTDAQIKDGLAAFLKIKFPDAKVGQKYQLSYVVYSGARTTLQTTFIKEASGNYVEFTGS